MEPADPVEILYQLILLARRDEAGVILSKAVADHGYSATLRDLLEPALFMIGDRWAADGLSLAQGFVAGKIAEDFFQECTWHTGGAGSARSGE